MKQLLLSLAFLSLTSLGFAQTKTDYSKLVSLVKEEKQKGNDKIADSLAQNYINNYLFRLTENQLNTKDNLLFISENLSQTNSQGFIYFLKHRDKINSVLGADKAEYALKYAIARQFLPKNFGENHAELDLEKVERIVTAKFGSLGQEMVYGKRMEYFANVKDWNSFGKYYKLYFEKALKRPEYNINAVTWPLFENVNNSKILRFACDVVMKYAIEEWYQNDPAAWDTYANLLYKIGRTAQAIEWEEKAVKLSNKNQEILENFEKMKKNIPTWGEKTNN